MLVRSSKILRMWHHRKLLLLWSNLLLGIIKLSSIQSLRLNISHKVRNDTRCLIDNCLRLIISNKIREQLQTLLMLKQLLLMLEVRSQLSNLCLKITKTYLSSFDSEITALNIQLIMIIFCLMFP